MSQAEKDFQIRRFLYADDHVEWQVFKWIESNYPHWESVGSFCTLYAAARSIEGRRALRLAKEVVDVVTVPEKDWST